MKVTRRKLLASAGVLALAACTAQQLATALPQYAQDAETLAKGLLAILPQLQSTAAIPAAAVAKASAAITDMQNAAAAVIVTTSVTAAQPLVQQLESDLNALVSAVGAFAALLPPPIGTAIAAATVLLPVIETAVNLAVKPSTAALPPILAAQANMTQDAARVVLQDLAK